MPSLREKVEAALVRAAVKIIQEHGEVWVDWFGKILMPSFFIAGKITYATKRSGRSPLEIAEKIVGVDDFLETDDFWDRLYKEITKVFIWVAERTAYITGPLALAQYGSARKSTIHRLDPSLLSIIRHRLGDGANKWLDDLKDQGWSDERIEVLRQGSEVYLDAYTQLAYKRREKGKAWDIDTHLARLGYPKWCIDILKEMDKQLPSAGDLVRMCVREAFDEAYWAKMGKEPPVPADFTKYMSEQGFTPEWSKRYWRAHWNVPSPLQGFEMLQRRDVTDKAGIISDSQLDELLHALDIMPFWRDKLKQISYHPLTRVDVRRIHALGGYDHDWLVARYQDVGFDAAKAEIMAKFTEDYNEEGDRDLTKAELLKLIKLGIASVDEIKPYLTALGYDEQEQDWLIQTVQWDKAIEFRTLQVGQLKKIYINLEGKDSWIRDQLGDLGYSPMGIIGLIDSWEAEKVPKKVSPTKADLLDWVKKDVITFQQYADALILRGYTRENAARYVAAAGGTPQDLGWIEQYVKFAGTPIPRDVYDSSTPIEKED